MPSRVGVGPTAVTAAVHDPPECLLHKAIYLGDLERLAALLRQDDLAAAVDAPDLRGNSALHLATLTKNVAAIEMLLGAGAQTKVKNRSGWNQPSRREFCHFC